MQTNLTTQSNLEGRTRLRDLLMQQSVRSGETFTLASGKTSDFYVDVKKTSLHPEGAFWLGRLLAEQLEYFPDIDAVGGPTLGADPLTTATIVQAFMQGRRLSGFIIRKEPKGHGTGAWIEGPELPAGSRVAIVEDVLTTGGSALKACDRAVDAGLVIDVVLAVVDRREGGVEAIEAAGFACRALFARENLV